MTVICPFAGRIYVKIGMKPLFITGALCMLLSNFGMFFITMHTPIYVAALLNTLRSAAIGFLMMPLITWGTNSIHRELTAHGTALLNSLRTILGAIGAAIFVGIMTAIAKNSSSLHGLNISFMCMSGVTLVLLLIGILLVKGKTR